MTEIPVSFLKAVTAEYKVSEAELKALNLALAGQTAELIASTLSISAPAVRKRLGSVYQKFGIGGGVAGKLEVLRNRLLERYQLSSKVNQEQECDFGEAPDVSVFFGRTQELNQLQRWVIEDRCRLVAIFGMAGIGKTALSVKLGLQIGEQFEYVIWRSLRHAPSIKDILVEIIEFLSENNENIADWEEPEVGISQLIARLRKYRCLILLDNAETILCSGTRAGQYRIGYEGYEELFRQIGEVPHQSCLVLTSREIPKEIFILEGEKLKVRALQLSGLENIEAKKIFLGKGDFSGSEEDWGKLINHYAGNPLALKIVSTAIQEVFGGNVYEFMNQGTAIFVGDVRNLLEQQFNRLSILEKDILYWLAINFKPTTFLELRSDIISAVSEAELIESLESLKRRSLIYTEKALAKFTLQPVVMEYIINNFIKQVNEELVRDTTPERISLFKSHALLKAQTEGKIRNTQLRLIIEPIVDQLIRTFGNKNLIKEHLLQILSRLRDTTPLTLGYAGGNVINLLCHLEIDLSGCDFSHLNIWQAYLAGVNLHNVNFSGSNLSNSVFTGIFDSILSIAFNPVKVDILATGDADGKISLWQTTYAEQLFTWKAHANWVRTVAFSRDGKILASSSDDHTVKLWDVESQKHLKTFEGHTNWIRSIAFSPQGNILASGSSDETIRLWDVSTYQCLKILKGHKYFVRAVAFSLDGKILASGSADHTVKLWDVNTGECLQTFDGHTKLVQSIAFSTDEKTLASGSDDRTVRLWNIKTGKCLHVLEGHTNLIHSVAFSPNGKILASGSDDRTVRLWDVNTGKSEDILVGHTNSIRSVAFSPDGKTLASAGYDKTVRFWDVETHQCIQVLQGYTNWIHDLAVSPNGKMLASCSDDRTLRLWDTLTGECIRSLEGHTMRTWCVAFSSDGQILASGGDGKTVRLWDVSTGQCIKTLYHPDRIRSIAFSPDGQTLASASVDCCIRLWNIRAGQCFETLQGHNNWVQTIAFSPDGDIIASGSDDKTLRLWDVHTGKCIRILEGHTMRIWSVAFSPISPRAILASGSDDQTIRLWDTRTKSKCKILYNFHSLRSIAFSPDGKIIASANVDHTVKIWDVDTGICLTTFLGHHNRVSSIVFSPDGQTLFSGSQDGAIKQWDLETGECIKTLVAKRPLEGMCIKGTVGLTEAQKDTLKELGATED